LSDNNNPTVVMVTLLREACSVHVIANSVNVVRWDMRYGPQLSTAVSAA
jgi:hypothetical protein